jgi:primosomal protein N' (replication factor Y)
MNLQHKKLVHVIPATNIPPDRNQVFSYLAPLDKNFKVGQEVLVPFGGRELRAVVVEELNLKLESHPLPADSKAKLKNITKIVDLKPALTKEQLKLAQWMAEYYCASLSLTVKTMLFPRVKSRDKDKITKAPPKTEFPKLTSSQQKIFKVVDRHLSKTNLKDNSGGKVFLLHGVTGSGKTEIYMRAIQKIIDQGKQIILLVPEISLTPQTIQRFAARFRDNQLSVFHSKLSAGEKCLAWQRIREEKAKIVIGPRSAVFAPVQNLGLIIIDEEHDPSYKQYDQNPRYHARDVALKMAKISSSTVILGSATPSIESYYQAKSDRYALLEMPERYSSQNQLPKVEVIDMREELKKKNYSIFSEKLTKLLNKVLSNKKQSLLFVNRRGASTFVMCRDCGYTIKCPNCSVSLTYHPQNNNPKKTKELTCHHCNFQQASPALCPKCKSQYIKYFGVGTQRVEKELNSLFPNSKTLRVDSDSMSTKLAHDKAYHNFASGKHDVLIGTQMIAKGWDLSNIDLVGIISSDALFNFPDFRCNERAFQLLTQVAGRTGRGNKLGDVILQTYNPKNFVIKAAAQHDYKLFYRKEIREREELKYPPYVKLVKITFENENLDKARESALSTAEKISSFIKSNKFSVSILGPAPAFISKIRKKYRWNIILKIESQKFKVCQDLLNLTPLNSTVDIDPEDLL